MSDTPNTELHQALGQVSFECPEPGRARIEYDVRPEMCHSGGIAQGGFVCGWMDAAMAFAAMSLDPDVIPLSLELKTSFHEPARPGRVIAEGWIERRGRVTCFAEARLLDTTGKVLAKCTSTLRLVAKAG